MRVTDDRGSPRTDVVDVARAVGVPQICAFGARYEARCTAHRAERSHRRIDAARNRALRAREELVVTTGHWGGAAALMVAFSQQQQSLRRPLSRRQNRRA